MFQKIFNPDNPLMITMTHITDCIFLSLFWMLGCFPVLTAGASFAALYDASFRALRKGEKDSWQRFWKTFRQNLKGGILPTVFFLIVLTAVGWGLIRVWNAAVYGTISWMVFSGAALAGTVVLGMLSVLFPMLSRFENSFAGLVKNTVLLSMSHMPRTLILGMVNALVVFLCARFVFPLFFLPAPAALIGSLLIEPMFRPYMNEENAAV